MKKIYTLLLALFAFSAFAQVESELTTFLNLPCDFTVCSDIQLGNCPGDINSQGEEYEHTNFEVYYVTEDVIIEYNSLTLRNCRLEFRNGANLVDNGIVIDIQGDCNQPDQITEIVFLGGGNRYPSVEAMNATLGINDPESQEIKIVRVEYYNILGQRFYDLEYQPKGVYFKKNHYQNGVVKTEKHLKR